MFKNSKCDDFLPKIDFFSKLYFLTKANNFFPKVKFFNWNFDLCPKFRFFFQNYNYSWKFWFSQNSWSSMALCLSKRLRKLFRIKHDNVTLENLVFRMFFYKKLRKNYKIKTTGYSKLCNFKNIICIPWISPVI